MAYNWTTAEHDVPYDVVMVSIGGQGHAEPTADVHWPLQVTSNGVFAAGQHVGWPVKEALERADELRSMLGLSSVVVALPQRSIWREEWGKLAPDEGLA